MTKSNATDDNNNNNNNELKPKPLKEWEVKVEFTDTVLGRDEEEAIEEFTAWLKRHTKEWKIISVTPTGTSPW